MESKQFNGKSYKYFGWTADKKEAQLWAKSLREKGALARVTKSLMDRRYAAYTVWQRGYTPAGRYSR